MKHPALWTLLLLLPLVGCPPTTVDDDDDDSAGDDDDDDSVSADEGYHFESRFAEGSSVAYAGQTFRHVLIADMKSHIDGMTARIDAGSWFPSEGDVVAELDFYFEFDGEVSGDLPHGRSTTPAPLQSVYGDLHGGTTLAEKVAGNDAIGQYRDWSTGFAGWGATGSVSPEGLVRQWFDELDALVVARAAGTVPTGPDNTPIAAAYVSPEGLDYGQLLQKFMLGAIAFSQSADDYLDDDTDGKGLLASNADPGDGGRYSGLEHAWDEGFGYFGPQRDLGDFTTAQIVEQSWHDSDGDGAIDLMSEWSVGNVINAAKRDEGALVETTMMLDAWDAFLAGRVLIANAGDELTSAEMSELQGYRDTALWNWEAAIAATVVHYINDTLQDMAAWESDPGSYSFLDHAKHWSELKGFALGHQFNRRSPLLDDFEELHALIGDAPALPGDADWDSYRDDLLAARALVGAAFDFDAQNLGDDDGRNGW